MTMNKNFIPATWTLLFVLLGQRLLIKCIFFTLTFPAENPKGLWEYLLAIISSLLAFGAFVIYFLVLTWIRDQFYKKKLGAISISFSLFIFTIIIFIFNYFQILYRIEVIVFNLLSVIFLFGFEYPKSGK